VVRRASPGAEPLAREVPPDLLVPGDIVRLEAGDTVPADVALLRSSGFTIGRALLTGESLPVVKQVALAEPASSAGDGFPFDDSRLCLLGATVVSGTATGVVVATGGETYFATRHNRLPYPRGRTTFDRDVRGISWTLIRFMLLGVVLVLAVTDFHRDTWLQSCLYAVTVAVGLIPEMLPVVVTSALIRAHAALRRRGALVKQLPAIHNLAAMDVVCIDKTGTLTLGRLSVTGNVDPRGRSDPEPLALAYLNARFSVDGAEPVLDIVDDALLRHGGDQVDVDRYALIQALAFDATRRRSTVALRAAGPPGQLLLITKGAAESIVDCCSRVRLDGSDQPLTPKHRYRLQALADRLHANGDRALAVAIGIRTAGARPLRTADEAGLTLIGYVCLRDEAKPSAAAIVEDLTGAGVRVTVLTGDHPIAAARSCRDAGIDVGTVVRGNDIDCLDDDQLAKLAGRTRVFARVDARQKARIVTVLRRAGHTVGYVGDGVNDAPALHSADVAVSVEDAVDLARQTSDVLLRGKDLAALRDAVRAGRHAYANVIKYVKITVSSNFGNVCAVVAASATMPFLPMLPLQILVQNLLFDLSQLSLAFDRTDPAAGARPRSFRASDLTRFVVCFGTLNALADVATFLVLRHTLSGQTGPALQALFHTGWFVENLLTQLLAVHLLRSRTTRAWTWAAWPVLATTLAVGLFCVGLPHTRMGAVLHLYPLPGRYYVWVTMILGAYGLALLGAKHLYQRAFRAWL
jgi:Mg2+-importing ATPase